MALRVECSGCGVCTRHRNCKEAFRQGGGLFALETQFESPRIEMPPYTRSARFEILKP